MRDLRAGLVTLSTVVAAACASAPARSPLAGIWVADGTGPVAAVIFNQTNDVWFEYVGRCEKGRFAIIPTDSLALSVGPSATGAVHLRYTLRADTLVLESGSGTTRYVRNDAYEPGFRKERCPNYQALTGDGS